MSNVHETATTQTGGAHVRAYRVRADLSLDDLADMVHKLGYDRPSIAKLSRIETGLQPVPDTFLAPLVTATGIPARMLRPDLAKLFDVRRSRAPKRTRRAA